MERLRAKLKSESGASITYALLLFLVCAALSSVIIIAATTASGRIKNLSETDQRYYSVMSAAELMRDLIDDKPITVVTVSYKNSGTHTYYVLGHAGEIDISQFTDNSSTPEENAVAPDADPDTPSADESADPDPTETPFSSKEATNKKLLEHIVKNAAGGATPEQELSLTFSPSVGDDNVSKAMAARMAENWYPDGSVNFSISNDPEDSDDPRFILNLFFKVDIKENTYNLLPDDSAAEEDAVIISATEYTWHLASMTTTD